eukprot:328014-Chlamydomonas_euryale.AAC.1
MDPSLVAFRPAPPHVTCLGPEKCEDALVDVAEAVSLQHTHEDVKVDRRLRAEEARIMGGQGTIGATQALREPWW